MPSLTTLSFPFPLCMNEHLQAKTHFLVIPKIRAGLTQLSKAEEGHKALLGHLLYTVGRRGVGVDKNM